jgi:transposase InsO family protein
MTQEYLNLLAEALSQYLKHKISLAGLIQRLHKSRSTIFRYLKKFLTLGPEGLKDKRTGHNRKVTLKDELNIVRCKREGLHRSARFIRDKLKLKVYERTIWFHLVKHGLNRATLSPIKPITHFEAKRPNDLWQIDIMGKMRFPHLGYMHLILIKDDRSRFLLTGLWVKSPSKVMIFACLYKAFMQYGIPKAILSDKGSQFKSPSRIGLSDYQEYLKGLNIEIIYGRKPRTKGKLERRFEFIQRDFVLENLDCSSIEELNKRFKTWIYNFNYDFKSRVISNHTPSYYYRPSKIRKSKYELQHLLIHEEPRRVYMDSTISYYGNLYKIPPGYLKCRVWTKLRGDTLFVESCGKVIIKHKLVR